MRYDNKWIIRTLIIITVIIIIIIIIIIILNNLWDIPIHTDRTTAANRPDIVLKNKKDKACLLIDMTTPLDTNTSVKTTEKLNKYKDLKSRLSERGGSKQQQFQWLCEPLAPSRRTWKTTPTKSLAASTFMNSRR